jgi:hypothetical protein
MLQRVEAEVGETRRLRVAVDAEDAALVAKFVCRYRRHWKNLLWKK